MTETMSVTPVDGRVQRGCGYRVKGACYITCGLTDEGGLPIEHFLIDSPIEVSTLLNVPRRGVTLVERSGVWHVLDYVGAESYPNVADFVEEVRRFGLSRRASKGTDFSKLTAESRILLCHSRAYIENWQAYREAEFCVNVCPKDKASHLHGQTGPCLGTCWEDVEGGNAHPETPTSREILRQMPSFNYVAHRRPDGVEPVYREAFFMSLPITRLEVVRDDVAGTHKDGIAAASEAAIDVAVVDC